VRNRLRPHPDDAGHNVVAGKLLVRYLICASFWRAFRLKGPPEMTEILSIGLVCPKCGKQLVGPRGTNRAALTDTLSCPEHGEIGLFKDMIQKLSENVHHNVEDAINQFLKDTDSK
jgi:hypothetical protein